MQIRLRPRSVGSRAAFAGVALSAVLVLSACGGGASDSVGGDEAGANTGGTALTLIAYAVPKPGWDAIVPAYADSEGGEAVSLNADYGASGNQSRKVADGAPADLVNFSVEPDIDRLVDAGRVDADWNAGEYGGVPFGSVVSLVVREGNPKNINDWPDLLRDDVEVISPSPLSSGSAKWNLLAPYAAVSNGGQDRQAGLDYVTALVDQFPIQPESGRAATEAFLQGQGDVLLSYENEALLLERDNQPVDFINPPSTFRIDNPVAVINDGANVEAANRLNDFLYTEAGQRVWAEQGFRPVNQAVAAEFAGQFPAPQRLWTIDDLGGWDTVDAELFGDGGQITAIYTNATG